GGLGPRTIGFTLQAQGQQDGWPARVAFSPMGTIVAVGLGHPVYADQGGSVRLWDYPALKEVITFSSAGSRIAFSPDGKILASGSEHGAIKLWEISSGQIMRTLENAGDALCLAFSPP